MLANQIAFFVLAVVAVASALGVVTFRNPIYSMLSLILNLLSLAFFFLMLEAIFIAAIQVLGCGHRPSHHRRSPACSFASPSSCRGRYLHFDRGSYTHSLSLVVRHYRDQSRSSPRLSSLQAQSGSSLTRAPSRDHES